MNANDLLTIGQLADEITQETGHPLLPWRIARLFELRVFAEPPRVGNRRIISRTMKTEIVSALRERGWLPAQEEVAHA